MVTHVFWLSPTIGIARSALMDSIMWLVFAVTHEVIMRWLARQKERRSTPTWQDLAGHRTGLDVLAQGIPDNVQLVSHAWGTGAIFDRKRRRIHAAIPSLNRRDLATVWTTCHELWHPTQTGPFWNKVFALLRLGEWVWIFDVIFIGSRDFLRFSRGSTEFATLMAVLGSISYFWGDFLPEFDAVIHTPDSFARNGFIWSDSDTAKSWIDYQIKIGVINYLGNTLILTTAFTLLVVMLNRVVII